MADDTDLDRYFQDARAQAPEPQAGFREKVLAAALAEQAHLWRQRPERPEHPGRPEHPEHPEHGARLRRFLRLGELCAGGGGLVAAGCAGLWVGFAQPLEGRLTTAPDGVMAEFGLPQSGTEALWQAFDIDDILQEAEG